MKLYCFCTVPKIIWISVWKPCRSRLKQMQRYTYCTVCMFFVPDICFFQRRCNVVSAPVVKVSVTCLNSGYCWDSVTTVLLGQCGHRILNVFLFVIPIVYFIINTSFNLFLFFADYPAFVLLFLASHCIRYQIMFVTYIQYIQ